MIWWRGSTINERYRRLRSISSRCCLNVRLKRSSYRSWGWRIPSWAHIALKIGIPILRSTSLIEKNMTNSCRNWTQQLDKTSRSRMLMTHKINQTWIHFRRGCFIYKPTKKAIRFWTRSKWTNKSLEWRHQLSNTSKNRRFWINVTAKGFQAVSFRQAMRKDYESMQKNNAFQLIYERLCKDWDQPQSTQSLIWPIWI